MSRHIGDAGTFYKIGYQLAYAGGFAFAEELIGKRQEGVSRSQAPRHRQHGRGRRPLRRQPRRYLPDRPCLSADHARGRGGRAGSALKILARDRPDLLRRPGPRRCRLCGRHGADLVATRAEQASRDRHRTESSARLRKPRACERSGPDRLIVTPGIRPSGSAAGDQKRILTPSDAIRAGADHLVVARPIVQATDPRGAAQTIVEEISAASPA